MQMKRGGNPEKHIKKSHRRRKNCNSSKQNQEVDKNVGRNRNQAEPISVLTFETDTALLFFLSEKSSISVLYRRIARPIFPFGKKQGSRLL